MRSQKDKKKPALVLVQGGTRVQVLLVLVQVQLKYNCEGNVPVLIKASMDQHVFWVLEW
jgi:hypothetical protein